MLSHRMLVSLTTSFALLFPSATLSEEICEIAKNWTKDRGFDDFVETMTQMTVYGPECIGGDRCPPPFVYRRDKRDIVFFWEDAGGRKLSELPLPDLKAATPEDRAVSFSMAYVFSMLDALGFNLRGSEVETFTPEKGSMLFVLRPRSEIEALMRNPDNEYSIDFSPFIAEFESSPRPCITTYTRPDLLPLMVHSQVLVSSDQRPEDVSACIVQGAFQSIGLDAPDGADLFDDSWGSFPARPDVPEVAHLWTQRDLAALSLLYGLLEPGMTEIGAREKIRQQIEACPQ